MLKEDLFNVNNKVVVITGGGGVLGGSMGEYLAKLGAKLVLLDLKEEPAEERANKIIAEGGEAIGLAANVLEKENLETVNKQILDKWGKIDVLINAAGGNMPGATVGPDQTVFDVSVDDLKKVLDLNLMGSVIPSLVFGKTMTEQKKGSIINISSMAATRSISRVMGYSLAKAGIDMLTRWMALELSSKFGDGLRVNAIAPGFFIGNQNRRLLTNEDGSYTERGNLVIQNTPMGRFGEAPELNGAIHYLCSDASQFVTGTILPIDGGFSSFTGV